MTLRHKWSAPIRFRFKTERACERCGIVKVTRHDGDYPWIEFYCGLDRIISDHTPPCVRAAAEYYGIKESNPGNTAA